MDVFPPHDPRNNPKALWVPDTLELDTATDKKTSDALARYWWAWYVAREAKCLFVNDFGCGTGYGSRILAELPGREVRGYDINALALEVAKQEYPHEKINWHRMNFDEDWQGLVEPADLHLVFDVVEELRHRDLFLMSLADLIAAHRGETWVLFSLQCDYDQQRTIRGPRPPLAVGYSLTDFTRLLRRFFSVVIAYDSKLNHLDPGLPGVAFLNKLNVSGLQFGRNYVACRESIKF